MESFHILVHTDLSKPDQLMTNLLQSTFIFILSVVLSIAYAQDRIAHDSVKSPFRKGRWLTGITGSIDSDRNETKSIEEITSSNEYAINIVGGNFFKDRWLVGGIIQADRSDAEGTTDINTETIFIGPQIAHYFSDSPRGSLFLSLSPGYTRYRNLVRFGEGVTENEEVSEGSGFAFLLNLGYSYVVFDRIAFDIGFGVGQFWVDVDRELQPEGTVASDNIKIRNFSFSFGFRVLLDRLLQ